MIDLILKKEVMLFFNINLLFFIKSFVFLLFSFYFIISDLKKYEVNSRLLILLTIIVLIFNIALNKKIFFYSILGLCVVYSLFLLIYFLSRGGIGSGDMFYMGYFSTLFGFIFSIFALILSFWLATIILIIPFIQKKVNSKTRIPMIPFLFLGNVLTVIIAFIIMLDN